MNEELELIEEPIEEVTPVEVVEPVEVPVVPVVEPVEPVELPEQVYVYQPKDESGRPLGGKQAIKFRTQNELAEKFAEQNTLLIRKLRQITREQRTGPAVQESIPEDAVRFPNTTEFTPRQLSPEERRRLSLDLIDPEKFDEATSMLMESSLGAKPEELRAAFRQIQMNNQQLMCKAESEAFAAANPAYFPCAENFESITGWMIKNNLAPIRKNFQLAYDTLGALEGVIVRKAEETVPETIVVPVPIPPVEPVVEPTETIVTPKPRGAVPPSGFTRSDASDVAVIPTKKYKYTLAQVNSMSGDEYGQKLKNERGFAELVDKLEVEARKR